MSIPSDWKIALTSLGFCVGAAKAPPPRPPLGCCDANGAPKEDCPPRLCTGGGVEFQICDTCSAGGRSGAAEASSAACASRGCAGPGGVFRRPAHLHGRARPWAHRRRLPIGRRRLLVRDLRPVVDVAASDAIGVMLKPGGVRVLLLLLRVELLLLPTVASHLRRKGFAAQAGIAQPGPGMLRCVPTPGRTARCSLISPIPHAQQSLS